MKGLGHGKGFRAGQARGTRFRSSGLNKQSNWSVAALHTKRDNAANNSRGMSSRLEDGKKFDLAMVSRILSHVVLPNPLPEGPPKRQNEEVEKVWLRANRGFRKCSRNCNPRSKGGGFGCQLHHRFASCPMADAQDHGTREYYRNAVKVERVKTDSMTPDQQKAFLASQVDWSFKQEDNQDW